MLKLKEEFRKNGLDYKLLRRSDKNALVGVYNDGGRVVTEVHKIKINPEGTIKGVEYPKREGYRCNEDFGYYAWCYTLPEDAEKKYKELEENV